jgi:hypothetical protein
MGNNSKGIQTEFPRRHTANELWSLVVESARKSHDSDWLPDASPIPLTAIQQIAIALDWAAENLNLFQTQVFGRSAQRRVHWWLAWN